MKEELKGAARTNKQTWIQAKFRICLFNICQTWTKVYLSLVFFLFILTIEIGEYFCCIVTTVSNTRWCKSRLVSNINHQIQFKQELNERKIKIKKTALLCCWFNYSIRLEDQIENTARKRIFISLHKQIDLWECLQAFSMEPHRFLSFKRRHKCEGGCTFVEYSVGDHLRRSISGLHTSGTSFIYVTYVH